MKFRVSVIAILLICFSCKKKSSASEEQTTPAVENGNLNINILSYDSLGNLEAKTYNTSVFLSGTSYSATTDSNGNVSFSLPPATYAPSVLRPKYEGVPFSAVVSSKNTSSVSSFVAQNSTYSLQITNANAVNQSSVTLSMNLSQSVPAGKQVKVAVLFGTTSALSVNSYSVVQEFFLAQQNNPNYNICSGSLQTAINQLTSGSTFRLLAVPVSYGNYFSTVLNKNILVGDYLPPVGVSTASYVLTKSW
ncbi:MAG: hypothetical protein JWO32_1084 [Bacteroidetes bacterium]|nr:hypothetical protein [Bacteroidota bacterium]